ncbi:MAG TPA: ThiF family adenylyltransferase, partial [Thermoanaerobaculia bacterium]|nr:ThiF family adenylyltransferase [Thermoanaerobaculia bacterium]
YSPSDDFGERRLLEVLALLLPGATPASLVLTHQSVTGRQLTANGFIPLSGFRVAGAPSLIMHFDRKKKRSKVAERFDRQVRAFGAQGQLTLGDLRVAVIGAGGIGSVVAEQLARAGIAELTIVDDDVVERSNLSRLFGATIRTAPGLAKAEILARHVKRLGAKRITALKRNALSQSLLLLLRECDLVFSCVDNDRTRAVLSRFAHQYLIPLIDMGARLDARVGRVTAAAGRVSIVGSGLTCLRCSNHLNSDRIRAESLSAERRTALAREGYVMGIDEPAPAIVSINTVVGGLGVTGGLNLFVNLTGGVQPLDQAYDATSGSVFPISPRHDTGCDICDETAGLKGLGDLQVVSAYP